MIEFVEVMIGSGGVGPCARCTAEEGSARLADDIAADSDASRPSGGHRGSRGISLIGFEPFAHPDLPRLIATSLEAGFGRIRLRTDAGALGRQGNAPGVLGAGVTDIEVVARGGEADHDRLTGRPGLFSAALSGIAAYRAAASERGAGVAVTGLVPVCRHTPPTAPAEAVAALAAAGAIAVRIEVDPGATVTGPDVAAALETGITAAVHTFATGAHPLLSPLPRLQQTAPWLTVEACR